MVTNNKNNFYLTFGKFFFVCGYLLVKKKTINKPFPDKNDTLKMFVLCFEFTIFKTELQKRSQKHTEFVCRLVNFRLNLFLFFVRFLIWRER